MNATRLLLLLLPCGCHVDNQLAGTEGGGSRFDTGETSAPDIDSADIADSGLDTDTLPVSCPDPSFPGYAIPQRAECAASMFPVYPSWELTEKWGVAAPDSYLRTAPSIGQLNDDDGDGRIDDDDIPDVVIAADEDIIAAYSGDDGRELWRIVLANNRELGVPAIGDLDGDGFPEVVVGGLIDSVALHGEDGSAYWTGPGSTRKAMCGGIGIADLDADGDPEVYFGAQIIDGQAGSLIATGNAGVGTGLSGESPMSVAADLDLDGDQEVIVGNAAYDYDGETILVASESDGFPAVGNFDADPEGEVVVSGNGSIRLVDDDGTTLWTTPLNSLHGPPVIADLDGDGDPEIAIPDFQGVHMLEGDGSAKWAWTASHTNMWFGASAYDLDGDGAWEVLLNVQDAVLVFDGATGTVRSTWPHVVSDSCGNAPVVADLDGDGHVEIAATVAGEGGSGTAGLYVLEDGDDAFVPGGTFWNAHDFSITNIEPDGDVPEVPATNWLDYNNFRAGPRPEEWVDDLNLLVDIVDVCDLECDEGRVTVWLSIGNDGAEAVDEDVPVRIYGETDAGEVLLWEDVWGLHLEPAWMGQAVAIELEGVPRPLDGLRVTLDGGDDGGEGQIRECDETDNEGIWSEAVCP